MPERAGSRRPNVGQQPPTAAQPRTWKLEDAKAHFSEVVRRARTEGPQRVTVRGKDAVVVIAAETLARVLPKQQPQQNLVDFLQSLDIAGLDLPRERDSGRDIPL